MDLEMGMVFIIGQMEKNMKGSGRKTRGMDLERIILVPITQQGHKLIPDISKIVKNLGRAQ
jgi:hypothetical protein